MIKHYNTKMNLTEPIYESQYLIKEIRNKIFYLKKLLNINCLSKILFLGIYNFFYNFNTK